jgi:hypothetical protein
MAKEEIAGRTFEPTQDGPTPEELAGYAAGFAEFNARRNAAPPEDRVLLTSGKFGGDDMDGTEYEDQVRDHRATRAQEPPETR